jgi:LPPG:FO 2-phospho-L-lactate transferase
MKVVALSGGVGGAKLVDGLAQVLSGADLTVIVNTGDDFTHWGLPICPDLDTIMYTLAGLSHPTQGWGLAGETFQAFAMVERYGGASWFRLGDRDLATHLMRAERLAAGCTLTEVTAELCGALGVAVRVLPMSDAPRPTVIDTADGTLTFQDWLVRRRGEPVVTAVRSEADAAPTPQVLAAIDGADVIVIGPSNPYVSIDPILDLPGVRDALRGRTVVAVSPIVGDQAVKGPLAAMIGPLSRRPVCAESIAAHYGDLLDGFVLERGDAAPPWLRCYQTGTVMTDRMQRTRLAAEVLAFAEQLKGASS